MRSVAAKIIVCALGLTRESFARCRAALADPSQWRLRARGGGGAVATGTERKKNTKKGKTSETDEEPHVTILVVGRQGRVTHFPQPHPAQSIHRALKARKQRDARFFETKSG